MNVIGGDEKRNRSGSARGGALREPPPIRTAMTPARVPLRRRGARAAPVHWCAAPAKSAALSPVSMFQARSASIASATGDAGVTPLEVGSISTHSTAKELIIINFPDKA